MGNLIGIFKPCPSERIAEFIHFCHYWIKAVNLIRRGRRNNWQEDLDEANDILVPKMVEFGVWNGETGEAIDKEFCKELWNYIKEITNNS